MIEDEDNRGYCYTGMFHTKDGYLLCAYNRGNVEEDMQGRLGMMKIKMDTIE